MARYEIIDEPHAKPWGERLIVDPIVILLAAIIVPLFWEPPMLGRFWMAPVWLVVNGYALGSATFGKEVATLVLGACGGIALYFGGLMLLSSGVLPLTGKQTLPYVVILMFAVFFLTMYLVVFRQAQSYALYKYIKGDPA